MGQATLFHVRGSHLPRSLEFAIFNKSRVRHYRRWTLGSNLRYLNAVISIIKVLKTKANIFLDSAWPIGHSHKISSHLSNCSKFRGGLYSTNHFLPPPPMKLPLPPEVVHRVLCGVLFGNTSKATLYFHYIE